MEEVKGLSAYKTFVALSLHFVNRDKVGGYDGWKYNFNTRVSEKSFAQKKDLMFQYAAIEREFPGKLDQIKFFYPGLKQNPHVQARNVWMLRTAHRDFMVRIDSVKDLFQSSLLVLNREIDSFFDLFDVDDTLPRFYQLYDAKVIDYDTAVILCAIIPELNTLASQEPFVFDRWMKGIQFDKKFMSLYLNPPTIKQLKHITFETFKKS